MNKGWMTLGITCFCISLIWFFIAYGQYSGEMFPCFFADTMKCKIARGMGGFASFIGARGPSGSFHPWLTWLSFIFMLMGLFIQSNKNDNQKMKKCPKCAETIKYEAAKCKHCGEEFDLDEHTKQELYQQSYDNFQCPNCSAEINRTQESCHSCNFDLRKFMH